ncbi:hypothetical protein RyT2_14930 [Pseudolactococcus yaeyamensis]
MERSLDQAIHDKLWALAAEFVGANHVFEYRPMSDTAYPFIDFQDFQTNFDGTKNGLTATASATLNVWDTEDKRKSVSDICHEFVHQLSSMRDFYGYPVSLRMGGVRIQITKDITVKPYIWRGLINLEFLV